MRQPRPGARDPIEQSRAFLRTYRQRYERVGANLRAGKGRPGEEAPERFDNAPAPGDRHGKVRRWMRQRGGKLVAFYDDGQDLPDVERLAIVSMTTASVDRDGSSIDADVWVLEVFPRKANA